MRALLVLLGVFCLGTAGCANDIRDEDAPTPESPSGAYNVADLGAMKADLDWLDEATTHELGRYTVHAPIDDSNRLLVVGPEGPTISVLSRTVTIRDAEDRILLQLQDVDRDGTYDSLSYPTSGSTHMVVDRDLDGQADLRIPFRRDDDWWAWYDGSWRQVSVLDTDPNLILVDDVWRPYEVVGSEIRLLDE